MSPRRVLVYFATFLVSPLLLGCLVGGWLVGIVLGWSRSGFLAGWRSAP